MERIGRVWALLLCLALLLAGCGTESTAPASAPSAAPAAAEDAPPSDAPAPVTETGEKPLMLWLTEELPLGGELARLAKEYAASQPEADLRVIRFDSLADLRAALEQGSPDLLLCSEAEAEALAAEDRLGRLEPAWELPILFRDAPAVQAGGFCPLCAETTVLALAEEDLPLLQGCDSLEALCRTASDYARDSGKPFFSADSFAQLFAVSLAQKGSPFYADRELDLSSASYREVYNLLADAAYEGGLVSLDEAVLSAVMRGDLVCGVFSSRALSGIDRKGLAVLPLPPMAGCEGMAEARIWGLAVTSDSKGEKASAFLGWLYGQESLARAALERGTVPAADWDWSADDAVCAGLGMTAQACRGYFPAADSGYLRGGVRFEQSFRAALALLG